MLPVGLPAAFERKLAVTEPWTEKPPLRATWLTGQSTVNCFVAGRRSACDGDDLRAGKTGVTLRPCGTLGTCVALGTLRACGTVGTLRACVALGTLRACGTVGTLRASIALGATRCVDPAGLCVDPVAAALVTLRACVTLGALRACRT